jgi:lantibiotic modifying enzyme
MTTTQEILAGAPAVQVAGVFPRPELRYLEVADAIGSRLVRDAVWSGGRCGWMTWTKEAVGGAFRPVHRAAPPDVYLGAGGIGLFLAWLSTATHDRHQREAAEGAARRIHEELSARMPGGTGFYSGAGSAAWALARIGDALGEERWIHAGVSALAKVGARAAAGPAHDLLSGHAGLVVALVDAAGRFGSPRLLDDAARVSGLLVDAAEHGPEGASWPSGAGESRNLVGISHGTTGIALALLELHRVRPEARFLATAREAIRYERALYDARQRNWPDFRAVPGAPPGQAPGFPVAWCHGSTGMGLARVRMRELLPDDPHFLPEIDAAVANVVAVLNTPTSPPTTDFTLCHGTTGNSELLLVVAQRLGKADALAVARRVGDAGYQMFHAPRIPWTCGITENESPALMTGTAGIGLHYLRLYDPEGVPGILLPDVFTG